MTPSHDGSPGPGTYRDRLLLALAFGGTFLSRAVAGSVAESLRAELWLTDQALGTLSAVFAGAFAVALPAAAALSARFGRRAFLVVGLVVCGAATAASAWAVGFWTLVVARTAAGAGAGTAALLAASLLFDRPRKKDRSPRPVLFLAALAGLSLGYLVGGLTGNHWSYRGAFLSCGAAILLLGFLALFATEDCPRRARDPFLALRRDGLLTAARGLLSSRPALLTAAATVVGTAGASALLFWLPPLLERGRGVPRSVASFELCATVLAAGLSGAALARGALKRGAASGRATSLAATLGTLFAASAVAVALYQASPTVYLLCLLVALSGLFLCARAAAFHLARGLPLSALALFAILLHATGELLGAFGLGALADRASFGRALLLLPGLLATSALLYLCSALSQEREGGLDQRTGERVASLAARSDAATGAPDKASL